MVAKKKAVVFPDPTVPDVAVEIDGREFRLCFDFRAMAVAKSHLRKIGVEVNLLQSLDFGQLDIDAVPYLFFAAALHFQPELQAEDAVSLVAARNVNAILAGLVAAYQAAVMEPGKNPPEATPES